MIYFIYYMYFQKHIFWRILQIFTQNQYRKKSARFNILTCEHWNLWTQCEKQCYDSAIWQGRVIVVLGWECWNVCVRLADEVAGGGVGCSLKGWKRAWWVLNGTTQPAVKSESPANNQAGTTPCQWVCALGGGQSCGSDPILRYPSLSCLVCFLFKLLKILNVSAVRIWQECFGAVC